MTGNKLNQKAAESYSKSFSSIILEKHFPTSNAITGQQILDITPVKQVNFYILKVLFLQWQEETKKFQSPFFDYSKPEVKDGLKSLINTLSKNILIKKEPFRPLLEKAVLDTITLMYNPTEFFITEFSNLPNVTRIQGFKGLSKYIKLRKNIYNKIVEKLDNDGNQVITNDEIKTLVQFVVSQQTPDNDDISGEADLFSSILPLDVFEKVKEEEPVVEIIDEPIAEEEILIKVEEEEDTEEVGEIIIEEEELDEINQDTSDHDGGILIEKDDHEEVEEEENMDEEFSPIVEVKTAPAPIIAEKPTTVNEKFTEEKHTINEKFENNKPKSSIAEVHETEKISEIQKSISVNQRYMFLNDLFNGDSSEYSKALEEVEKSNSFDESVELLVQNYSKKYEWDMNSDEVKELLKVIFKRFR
ncbi:hypothetical protein [Reichenbachiella sp. MALMAid0571]|uniref:hypothetical protein n=1 Tax=Reichenbachiella sp. MALMAid0571 TaxID=3143939 RepID=UPI0032DFC116